MPGLAEWGGGGGGGTTEGRAGAYLCHRGCSRRAVPARSTGAASVAPEEVRFGGRSTERPLAAFTARSNGGGCAPRVG